MSQLIKGKMSEEAQFVIGMVLGYGLGTWLFVWMLDKGWLDKFL